jgi:hypothetical protein
MAWLSQPLQAAEYSPDMPDYNNPGSSNILNVIPRTSVSYGPMAALNKFSTGLNARCQGAFSCADSAGNNYVFAGDTTKLYSYSSVSPTSATNISKVDGYWKFALFGQRVVATNFVDPMQSFLINSSSVFANLASAAPNARYITTAKGFLIAANTYDGTGGNQPQRVWWSGLNDPTNWPTPGTALAAQYQSSYNDLFGDGGWITGVVGDLGGCDVAVFMERRVWRGVYSGAPVVFSFYPAEGVRGTHMPNSIVQLGKDVFYIGEDGFYRFDGSSSEAIGVDKVDKTFFSMLDQNYLTRVQGAVDPLNKIIFWLFPSTSSTNGVCDKIICYNWAFKRWSLINQEAEVLLRSSSFGFTLDTMPGPLDSLTIPLDSLAWTGGNFILSGFDNTHSLGYFNGSTLAATIETSESSPFGETIATVKNTRPLIDGGSPTVSMAARMRLKDTETYGADTAMNSVGTCPLRKTGRYIRALAKIPAGSSWSHFQGINIDAEPNGEM